jgi:hypothetical protein
MEAANLAKKLKLLLLFSQNVNANLTRPRRQKKARLSLDPLSGIVIDDS